LWDITEKVFFVVGYNKRGFPPLRGTTEEVFSIVGNNGRGFFPLWDKMEKKDTTQNDIFKFKVPLIALKQNLRQISYLNRQTNPWKEIRMENYMVNHENSFFHCGIHCSRDFINL
jgi:hypothetical protein